MVQVGSPFRQTSKVLHRARHVKQMGPYSGDLMPGTILGGKAKRKAFLGNGADRWVVDFFDPAMAVTSATL